MVVGVLGLQGDFLEHVQLLARIGGVKPLLVKSPRDLAEVDALVIPGGESTTIGRLMRSRGLDVSVAEFARAGRPLMGTCAGAVLLAKRVRDRAVGETGQPLLELMDIAVMRNAFGRQRESFETEVHVEGVGAMRGVFIRAPAIVESWGEARIVGYVNHPGLGKVGAVAVQRNMMAVTFHPELAGDARIYELLLSMSRR